MQSPVLRYVRRSNFVEGLVDEWKTQHDQAMFALDTEELVAECVELGNLSKHAWACFRELLLKNPNAPVVEESGNVMTAALEKTLEVFRTVQRLVDEAGQRGQVIKDEAGLGLVSHEVSKISEAVHDIFAPLDPTMIEESVAAIKRGEFQTIEELIRAAQDGRFPPD